jgi:hypothetical protein
MVRVQQVMEFLDFMEPEGSFLHPQKPASGVYLVIKIITCQFNDTGFEHQNGENI